MVLSRRPARFKKPDFMQVKPISQEKMDALRAAAARVYINDQNPAEKSSEVNTVGVSAQADVRKEADNANGVQLLAAVATGLRMTLDKKVNPGLEEIMRPKFEYKKTCAKFDGDPYVCAVVERGD
ncbi:unnamed protein product [Sphenostylis stenocarpa]|uniref:Uncharacterized protein n=1 Tax=Sphenostylis stenocarpa TaxID=92480 RepID=A0AA86THL7_9FABA|nr:unnamed protein product [Sphenostylis stenocarpa]